MYMYVHMHLVPCTTCVYMCVCACFLGVGWGVGSYVWLAHHVYMCESTQMHSQNLMYILQRMVIDMMQGAVVEKMIPRILCYVLCVHVCVRVFKDYQQSYDSVCAHSYTYTCEIL